MADAGEPVVAVAAEEKGFDELARRLQPFTYSWYGSKDGPDWRVDGRYVWFKVWSQEPIRRVLWTGTRFLVHPDEPDVPADRLPKASPELPPFPVDGVLYGSPPGRMMFRAFDVPCVPAEYAVRREWLKKQCESIHVPGAVFMGLFTPTTKPSTAESLEQTFQFEKASDNLHTQVFVYDTRSFYEWQHADTDQAPRVWVYNHQERVAGVEFDRDRTRWKYDVIEPRVFNPAEDDYVYDLLVLPLRGRRTRRQAIVVGRQSKPTRVKEEVDPEATESESESREDDVRPKPSVKPPGKPTTAAERARAYRAAQTKEQKEEEKKKRRERDLRRKGVAPPAPPLSKPAGEGPREVVYHHEISSGWRFFQGDQKPSYDLAELSEYEQGDLEHLREAQTELGFSKDVGNEQIKTWIQLEYAMRRAPLRPGREDYSNPHVGADVWGVDEKGIDKELNEDDWRWVLRYDWAPSRWERLASSPYFSETLAGKGKDVAGMRELLFDPESRLRSPSYYRSKNYPFLRRLVLEAMGLGVFEQEPGVTAQLSLLPSPEHRLHYLKLLYGPGQGRFARRVEEKTGGGWQFRPAADMIIEFATRNGQWEQSRMGSRLENLSSSGPLTSEDQVLAYYSSSWHDDEDPSEASETLAHYQQNTADDDVLLVNREKQRLQPFSTEQLWTYLKRCVTFAAWNAHLQVSLHPDTILNRQYKVYYYRKFTGKNLMELRVAWEKAIVLVLGMGKWTWMTTWGQDMREAVWFGVCSGEAAVPSRQLVRAALSASVSVDESMYSDDNPLPLPLPYSWLTPQQQFRPLPTQALREVGWWLLDVGTRHVLADAKAVSAKPYDEVVYPIDPSRLSLITLGRLLPYTAPQQRAYPVLAPPALTPALAQLSLTSPPLPPEPASSEPSGVPEPVAPPPPPPTDPTLTVMLLVALLER